MFHQYPHGRRLCPLEAVQDYIQQRNLLAPQVDEFFITHRKPYHPASKDTLARWVKEVLISSGIDTSQYAAHSCRHDSLHTPSSHLLLLYAHNAHMHNGVPSRMRENICVYLFILYIR